MSTLGECMEDLDMWLRLMESTDVMGAFDEVYMKPRRCGYGTKSCFRNMNMKDNVNSSKTLMDG
jgi:hypothetical protein